MVAAHALLQMLRRQDPDAALDVLAAPWLAPLLARMPEVTRALPLPFGHGPLRYRSRRALGRSLRKRGYRRAFVLPHSLKSSLVPWFAGVPLRIGWRGEWRYGLLNDLRHPRDAPALLTERYAALACPAGAPLDQPVPLPRLSASPAQADATATALGLSRARPTLALCPGAAYGPAKRWPAAHYAAVARARAARGWQVWVLGSSAERAIAEELFSLLGPARPHCHDLVGAASLGQAVDLLSLADAVVSNDSGLMHVAAALARPQVAVFGSSSARRTPPMNPRAVALSLDLPCSPCFARDCPLGHTNCLRQLAPERVIAALDSVAAATE